MRILTIILLVFFLGGRGLDAQFCSGLTQQPYDPVGNCCGDCLGEAVCLNTSSGNCQYEKSWGIPLFQVSCENPLYSNRIADLGGSVSNTVCQFALPGELIPATTIPENDICPAEVASNKSLFLGNQSYDGQGQCCGDCLGQAICANSSNQNCRLASLNNNIFPEYAGVSLFPVSCADPFYTGVTSQFSCEYSSSPLADSKCCNNGDNYCYSGNQTGNSEGITDYNCDNVTNFSNGTVKNCPAGPLPPDCLYAPKVVTQKIDQCCTAWTETGQARYCYLGQTIPVSSLTPSPPTTVAASVAVSKLLTPMCQQAFSSSSYFFAQPLLCDGNLQPECLTPTCTSNTQCLAIYQDTCLNGNCVCAGNSNSACASGYKCTASGCIPLHGRYAFITHNNYALPLTGGQDQICQTESESSFLPLYAQGTYRAVLATAGQSLSDVVSSFASAQFNVYDAVSGNFLTGPLRPWQSPLTQSSCNASVRYLDCLSGAIVTRLNSGYWYYWTGSPDGSFFTPGTSQSTCLNWTWNKPNGTYPYFPFTPGVGNDGDTNWAGWGQADCSSSYPVLCLQADPIP